MDRIHSFEHISELSYEIDSRCNRVILANRREPSVSWSTANRSILTKSTETSAWLRKFRDCIGGDSSIDKVNHKSSKGSVLSIQMQQFDAGPYPSNEWRTSKYTLMNFLPKNLFEQFRRFANFYFLTTAVLQIVLPFSPVGPTTSLLPLIFVVATTSIKQAYEDYLRHKIDEELNNRVCHVLRDKKLVKIRSKDIRVGDFVYVKNNEEIPCDMILLAVGGNTTDRCHVTTANLDGETSLKCRSCSQILEQMGNINQLDKSLLVVECERPNATLYEFSGNLRAPKSDKAYELLMSSVRDMRDLSGSQRKKAGVQQSQSGGNNNNNRSTIDSAAYQKLVVQTIMSQILKNRSKAAEESNPLLSASNQSSHSSAFHEIPLDISNILLRASRLRNTSFVYGLAVYTGRDTKLAHNSQVKPNKFSSTESTVNTFLIIAFLILMTFSLIGTIRYKLVFIPKAERKNSEPFLEVFVGHFLLYNYLIPISLYVTLEFVKFFGTISVVEDKKMKAIVWQSIVVAPSIDSASVANTNQQQQQQQQQITDSTLSLKNKQRILEKPKCNSSDLNEELGQVEVLFSDKTGTLTENKMRFRACSIRGSMYRSIDERLYYQPADLYHGPIVNIAHKLAKVRSNRSSLVVLQQDGQNSSDHQQQQQQQERREFSAQRSQPFDHRRLPPLEHLKLIDKAYEHEQVVEFFICLCLCSTMTINEQAPLADCLPSNSQFDYDYQSASPDEQSLIEAAHAFGITMCKSNDRECFIVIEKSTIIGGSSSKRSKSKSPSRKERESSASRQLAQHKKSHSPSNEFKPLIEGKLSTNKYIVRHFERLLEFEFSSLRKRMSVIYKDCDNDCILMVSKGSEELLDCLRIDMEAEHLINSTLTHFEAFAKSGLRTLLVASRLLSTTEYESILLELKEAKLSIQNRDELTAAACRRAESGLSLIGTTAVEDTLQDGVPETIANLKEAGIKVWLLTGDKVETAISVAYLCKLLDREMTLFHLVRQQDSQACQRLLASFEHQLNNQLAANSNFNHGHRGVKSPKVSTNKRHSRIRSVKSTLNDESNSSELGPKFALIADGRSLHYAMKYAKNELARLCKQCTCVLGCRLSPLQKAEVVDMIKQSEESPITAAIGDGANDVSMIQEAHVGIGISGKEGKQAVNCSDFAIGRFQMLNRLFFVHGHLFYHRTANIIHYFFYKNLLFILPQFLYSCYNCSSAQSLYHPILLIGFNLFFTSLPILIYGLIEINIPEHALEQYPKFYTSNRANSQLKLSVFFAWMSLATIQAFMGFYLLQFNTFLLEPGEQSCTNGFATALYFIIIFTVTARLYSLAYSHNIYLNLSTLVSLLALPGLLYAYSQLDLRAVIDDNSLYGQVQYYLAAPMFWLTVGTIASATILPDLIWFIQTRMHHFRWLRFVMNDESSMMMN